MTVFTLCSSGMVLMEWMAAQTQCSPKVDGRSALIRTWPSNPSWTSHSLKMTWVSLVLSCFVVLPQCTVWYVVWIYTIFWLWMMKGLVWCLTAPHPPPGHPANIKWCIGISEILSVCLTAPHPPPGHPANIKWCIGVSEILSVCLTAPPPSSRASC